MSLRDALELLTEESDKLGTGITLEVNEKAFHSIGKQLDLNAVVWLPDSGPQPANVVLQSLLDQVLPNTGTYFIRWDYVEITTTAQAQKDAWIRLMQWTIPVQRERLFHR